MINKVTLYLTVLLFSINSVTGGTLKKEISTGKQLLGDVSQGRLCPNSTIDGTFSDLSSIFTTLLGTHLNKVGFLISIPISIISGIFWAIIFLIIYFKLWAKKEGDSDGGYSYVSQDGYSSPSTSYGYGTPALSSSYGRSLDKISNYVFNALEKYADDLNESYAEKENEKKSKEKN